MVFYLCCKWKGAIEITGKEKAETQRAIMIGLRACGHFLHFNMGGKAGRKRVLATLLREGEISQRTLQDLLDIQSGSLSEILAKIEADGLLEKVRQIFFYSLHNETISRFRRMMTLEQFRSPELAALYSRRYVERVTEYHAGIFRSLIAAGELRDEDAEAMALCYVAPVITLIGICDRQPEREAACLQKLEAHVRLFYRTFQADRNERSEDDEP